MTRHLFENIWYTHMAWDEIKLLYSCTKELLQRMSDAAEAIAKGDLVSKIVRAESQWALLPIQVSHDCHMASHMTVHFL